MPIRPELKHHYEGPAWQATRRRILARAENRCECLGECGKHGGPKNGYRCNRPDRTEYRNEKGKLVFVVLTVAHVNQLAGDDRDENLRAFCADCHLNYDTPQHVRNAHQTRREKKNNLELFE